MIFEALCNQAFPSPNFSGKKVKYTFNKRCKFGPKSLGESEAKRKIFSRGSAKRREAKKFLHSAKKSDKFSLLGEAKRSEKSEFFFSQKANVFGRMFE